MFQLLTVLVSFAAVPLLGKLKVELGPSLVATAIIMALLNSFGIVDIFQVFIGIFTTTSSLNTVLVVAMVGAIGALLKIYGILEKLVDGLSELISDRRILTIIVPAIFGTLNIPGGAVLSAPFVYTLGEELNIEKPKRAASNLVFRHVAMFVLPYSNSLLVAASITGIAVGSLISVNVFFAIAMVSTGCFLYLRKCENPKRTGPKTQSTSASLKQVLIYGSPIYACILLFMITGIPLYICMVGSVIIIYFLSPKENFFQNVFKSINIKTIIAVIGVFMIQGIVSQLSGLAGLFQQMFATGTLVLPALMLASFFFGLITGFHMAALSMVLPMLMTLDIGLGQMLAYMYFTYCWAFVGYYFSPLHMCQIFTCEYMDVKIKDLYKVYAPLMVTITIFLFVSYFAFSQILPLIFG